MKIATNSNKDNSKQSGYIKHCTIALLCLLLLCSYSIAKVFWTWGAADDTKYTIKQLGGKLAYETEMNINGRDGHTSVFSFNSSLPELVLKLSKTFADISIDYRGGTMAIAETKSGKKQIKMIIAKVGEKTLLFHIEAPAGNGITPDKHLLKEIPPFPGSTPKFYSKDKNTGMSLGVSSSTSSAASIAEYYKLSMKDDGWNPTVHQDGREEAQMLFYQKASSIAIITIDGSDRTGKTKITLLHKQQKMK